MPFLTTLAIIFLVYYFFKYTLRLLAPFILQSFAGHCSNIDVFINEDNSITVKDNGRGIPTD